MMRWLLVLCLVAGSLVGCSGRDSKQERNPSRFTAADVVHVLQEAGLQASIAGEIPESVSAFGVKGNAIKVGNETIQVYVYASEEAQRQIEISSDGYGIGLGNRRTAVEWIAPPHFVRKANIIVGVVTNNEQFAEQVRTAMENLK